MTLYFRENISGMLVSLKIGTSLQMKQKSPSWHFTAKLQVLCSRFNPAGSHENADILAVFLCQNTLLLSRLLVSSQYTRESLHLFTSQINQVHVYPQIRTSLSLGGLNVEANSFESKKYHLFKNNDMFVLQFLIY